MPLGSGPQIDDDRPMPLRPIRPLVPAALLWALAAGCSAEPTRLPPETPRASAAPAAQTAPERPERGPEYVLAEPEKRPAGTAVQLDNGAWGVLLDGQRAVVNSAGVTLAGETADAAITRVDPIPGRLGGGYLFRTGVSLYTSATFDGPLRPLVTVPASIVAVSFGPDAVLVRVSTGERWLLDAATGARKAPAPLGLVDIAALDDGRAAAVTEAGGLSLSTDGGKTWKDARSQLRGAPGDVLVRGGDLWVVDRLAHSTRALRVEASGALSDLGSVPPAAAPIKPDPRFPGGDTPRRAALLRGARVAPGIAVVAAGGDVLRVDLRSGAIVGTVPGVVPQNMACETVEVTEDVLLVCAERAGGSVVMSGLLSGAAPRIERSFPSEGPFFAGDDGALAIAGPCALPPPTPAVTASAAASTSTAGASPPVSDSILSVCVRNAEGQWQTFRMKEDAALGVTADKAPPPPAPAPTPGRGSPKPGPGSKPLSADQVRWIPRAGQPPIAVIAGKEIATFDVVKGERRAWQIEGQPPGLVDAARRLVSQRNDGRPRVVERRWSATAAGQVRAILGDGRAIEVSGEGVITAWPFAFDKVAVAGSKALATSKDGRAFQTLDGGRTWGEVQAPPVTRAGPFELRSCSALGCDLGGFLRLGWETAPPDVRAEVKKVARGPQVALPPLLEMGCVPAGSTESRAVTPTDQSPDDLAIGASFLPKVPPSGEFSLDRRLLGRAPVNVAIGGWEYSGDVAPRAMMFGFPISTEWVDRADRSVEEIVVVGPSRAPSSFRRELLFAEPLVPSAPVRKVSFGLDGISRAIKDSGVSLTSLVQMSNLDAVAAVPVTPAPAASSRTASNGDVLVSFTPSEQRTLYLVARGGSAPRADVLFARPGGIVQSAARLAGGDLVALAAGDEGEETILRFGATGAAEVAKIPAPPALRLAPANPDAIAVGPRGEIAVVRMPSGSEPPSLADPALLILPGPRVTALAPWSTAVPADDPACAGDTDAYRATLQTIGPWVRVVGQPFPDGSIVGMTARVRWSAARVCVEAVEVVESTSLTALSTPTETLVIATFGPGAAGRATLAAGSEARAPLSCALSPR